MTNEKMIENLNRLITGDVMERYYSPWCYECEDKAITAEAKRIAGDHKATAARIVVALTATDNPSAWAIEARGTPFDSPVAAVIRGELENTPDASCKWVSDRMSNRQPFFTGNETVSTATKAVGRDGWGKTWAENRVERWKSGKHYQHHPECQNRPELEAL